MHVFIASSFFFKLAVGQAHVSSVMPHCLHTKWQLIIREVCNVDILWKQNVFVTTRVELDA